MIFELRNEDGYVLYSGVDRPGFDPTTGQWVTPALVINAGGPEIRLVEIAGAAPAAPEDATAWLIDIGPFVDRFSTAKMAVLTSAAPVVRAIVQDMYSRKWIDLRRPDVSQSIDAIAADVAAVTPALKDAILNTPVTAEENRALRKVYFS